MITGVSPFSRRIQAITDKKKKKKKIWKRIPIHDSMIGLGERLKAFGKHFWNEIDRTSFV